MAVRKPLVIVSGQIEQLQAGDTLSGPFAENDTVSLTNGDSGSHTVGTVVYVSASDTVKKAKADAGGTMPGVAFATATIANGASGSYQTAGVLSGMSGLTFGAIYYVDDATAGNITATAPTTVGHYVQKVGYALSATELMIDFGNTILL